MTGKDKLAFPSIEGPGMTLRQYYAGQALANFRLNTWSDNPMYWESVARSAVVAADAMIAALKESGDG